MNEIICPHCSKAFKVDESGYSEILKQVHNKEFEKQLKDRLEAAALERQTAIQLAEARAQTEIQNLSAKLEASNLAQAHAVTAALTAIEKEREKEGTQGHFGKTDKHGTKSRRGG